MIGPLGGEPRVDRVDHFGVAGAVRNRAAVREFGIGDLQGAVIRTQYAKTRHFMAVDALGTAKFAARKTRGLV